MPWFKVDDTLYSHPKWLAASPAARALWVTAGSWCASQLTDGLVPRHVLPLFGSRPRDAAELVAVGLWLEDDAGWRFHDWLQLQPSAEHVEAERAAARDRQRRARDKARESRRDARRDSQRSHYGSHGPPDPTRPVRVEGRVDNSRRATPNPQQQTRPNPPPAEQVIDRDTPRNDELNLARVRELRPRNPKEPA